MESFRAPCLLRRPERFHFTIIGSWLEVLREDNRAIVRAASQASKAADHLLGLLPNDLQPAGSGTAHPLTPALDHQLNAVARPSASHTERSFSKASL